MKKVDKDKFDIIENQGGFANPDFLLTGNAKNCNSWQMRGVKENKKDKTS